MPLGGPLFYIFKEAEFLCKKQMTGSESSSDARSLHSSVSEHWNRASLHTYCCCPNFVLFGREQDYCRTTCDWLSFRIRAHHWRRELFCSLLFLCTEEKIGTRAIAPATVYSAFSSQETADSAQYIHKSGLYGLKWKTRDPYSLLNDSLMTRTHCSSRAIDVSPRLSLSIMVKCIRFMLYLSCQELRCIFLREHTLWRRFWKNRS